MLWAAQGLLGRRNVSLRKMESDRGQLRAWVPPRRDSGESHQDGRSWFQVAPPQAEGGRTSVVTSKLKGTSEVQLCGFSCFVLLMCTGGGGQQGDPLLPGAAQTRCLVCFMFRHTSVE